MSLADDHKMKEILCDNCDSGDVAETRCKECRMFLCHFCTECHKRFRATKRHQLLSIEELKSAAGPDSFAEKIRCVKHKEEVIKLYCKTCEVTICRDCTIVDHREHEYGFVEDVALKEKQKIQENLDAVKRRKVRVVQGIANLQKYDAGLVAKKEVIISKINGHFEELARDVVSRRKELVEKAESLTNSKRKQIQAQLGQLQMALASCDSSIGFTEQAFKNGNDVQILSMQTSILKSLKSLKRVKDQTQPCVEGNIVFDIPMTVEDARNRLFNLFSVNDDVTCPEKCKASFNDPSEHLKPGLQSTITVICNNKFNKRVQHGGQEISPTFTGGQISDVSVTDNEDGSHTVKFIARSDSGVLKFQVAINGRPAPSCSLTKNVKWVISDAHGIGDISNGGLTMSTDVSFGEQPSYRVGGCCFESGIHTWKVRLSARSVLGRIFQAEVGVIDCCEIDPNTKSSAHSKIVGNKKWVRNCRWQTLETKDVFLTLDMEKKTLKTSLSHDGNPVKFNHFLGVHETDRTTYQLTARRVCPFFASNSPLVSISIIE